VNRKLALIIGNSEYEDGNLAQLVTPDADVNGLAEVLRAPEIGGFDEVSALVNQPSTAVRRAIAGFFAGKARDDLLLLYFSGHGIRDDRGQLFLAVKDTEHDLLRGTAIPAAYITEEMDNSRSRRQVLVLDCCHSGAFSQGMKGVPGASVGTAAAFEGTGSGRVVLTATDSTQYAWEGERVIGQAANSVFTHYLIQGLRTGEADGDADGQITLDELYNYVYEQVVDETPMQTPGKWSYGQRGEIIIARNPRPAVKPVEIPPDLQQTIDDPRPWVREGAVRELDRLLRGGQPGLALAAQEALKRLAADDSRRVATMATESLAAYGQAQSPPEVAVVAGQETRTGPPEHAEQKQHPPMPAEVETERGPGVKATLEPLAHEKAATGQPAAEKTGVKAQQPARTLMRAVVPVVPAEMLWPLWLTVIGWAVVWACGWVVSEANGWSGTAYGSAWVLIGAIGGLITGLALRRAEPSVRWQHILVITIGWAISMIVSGAISQALYSTDSAAINGTIRGAIGGLIIGLVLLQTAFSIHWKQILVMTLGWSAGWTAGQAIGPDLYNTFHDAIAGTNALWLIPGGIVGAISAAIGGVVMFWQLGQARRHT
jgi:hypothetical protein